MDVLDVSERLWSGDVTVTEVHPWSAHGPPADVADGVWFLPGFANVSVLAAEGALVLVDTGSPFTAEHVHQQIRELSDLPLDTAVFSHGHIDHVFGVGPFDAEARARGWQRPRVVAHEAVPARFARYRLTAGWNTAINRRQFATTDLEWPTEYREPDRTYRDVADLEVGGLRLELHHARGETDDHTWTWVPERGVLCSGDLFIWATPNAGNPQKVQRYPGEWAAALREMAALGAEVLLPGHGVPIVGAPRIRQALGDAADLLTSLHDQTVALMNEGADLDTILHTVRAPADLLERPYLRPVYDDPEFIVRTVYRQYGGWWDGDPASLKPAPRGALASEVAALAGGAGGLAERALELLDEGELRLAGHLAQLALDAAPDDPEVQGTHARVYGARRDAEPSLMAKGIFGAAAATGS